MALSIPEPRRATPRPARGLILLWLVALLGSCEARGPIFRSLASDGATPSGAADAGPPPPWSAHVAQLDLPDCPPGRALVVDTAEDQLDGDPGMADPAAAGAELSFFEALLIAANREGQDNILFDPGLFPADAPREIVLQGLAYFPNLVDTCIDARDRGVILRWAKLPTDPGPRMPCCPGEFDTCYACVFSLGPGSRVQGLSLIDIPNEMNVYRGVVAGCRVGTDGFGPRSGSQFYALRQYNDSTIGPGNAIASLSRGVSIESADASVLLLDNDLGHDPLTGESFPLYETISPRSRARIEGNVLAATQDVINTFFTGSGDYAIEFSGNFVGVDRRRVPLDAAVAGLRLEGPCRYNIGPGNVFSGLGVAIQLDAATPARITRNSIYGNRVAIQYDGDPPLAPPLLEHADATGVRGRCPVDGVVELFSDQAGQGELFLGARDCTADQPWSFDGEIPAGRQVTATLTDAAGRTSVFSAPLALP